MLKTLCTLFLVLLFPLAAVVAKPLELSSRRVHLNAEDPSTQKTGGLQWRGGLELFSDDKDFGGLSGLLVSADGTGLTAVTDQGKWITARLIYDREGGLAGVTEGRIGKLIGAKGERLKGKRHKDAESLAQLGDGSVLVSFEHEHRILRYPAGPQGSDQIPEILGPPPGLSDLPKNKGLEALAVLGGERIVGITQGRDKDDDVAAFLRQDGRWSRFSYPKHGLYRPTGAARLPDGDLVVLERRFTWLGGPAARLVVIDAAQIRPGAVLEGREIAEFRAPFTVDNMEGIAARRGPDGETLIYLLSDDNFNALQRTLLLMFALET
jgi:hypothetical protein